MSMRMHKHTFRGKTSMNDGHSHYYEGETTASPDIEGHTHRMNGRTGMSNNHLHQFDLTTGFDNIVNGGHNHSYRGVTAYSDDHSHSMEGFTSIF